MVCYRSESNGTGGKTVVHRATGISWPTITKGLKELEIPHADAIPRVRRKGGGQKKLQTKITQVQ